MPSSSVWVCHQGARSDPGLRGDADQGRARSVWALCFAAIVARGIGGVPQTTFLVCIGAMTRAPRSPASSQAPQWGPSVWFVLEFLAYDHPSPPGSDSLGLPLLLRCDYCAAVIVTRSHSMRVRRHAVDLLGPCRRFRWQPMSQTGETYP